MIKPILTEKSLAEAKAGRYSFWVPARSTKHQIKKLIGETFGVHVVRVRTQSRAGGIKTTLTRRKITVSPQKKAIVSLKAKEKIDLFEGEKK
ncbi:50S ribosomal protein L23 [Candidatus Woesebacteria bacterium RIFCSPHIGHO2_01_FULL_44_21]|uniref:50S ribosomal protein L23 n=1 Tax=Candidatus Woesebacteria bacterium RIFCSPHIGHO2_01_FULL_44_21 TaxID=1802503 RepID=A0A1F7Z2U0_9BACT|nr:MAG: 50S ribosomal protein L23 [Candidatus Woesebacteria bacterium RIFCSPHIGHO2_01_FULL_44_21]OGM71486.1 MAG: 50S ribosomal protein L23 [Candidatus Woesebacteria bacterium RIFCSPLOWO2_01_FULL_44_24b]